MSGLALLLATITQANPAPSEPLSAPGYVDVVEIVAPLAPIAPPAPATVLPPAPVIPQAPPTFEVDPANYRLVLAGDVLVGIGGAGFLTMIGGLVLHNSATTQRDAEQVAEMPNADEIDRQQARVELGTSLAISGGAIAAGLFGAGIGLIVGGRKRERERREALLRTGLDGMWLRF